MSYECVIYFRANTNAMLLETHQLWKSPSMLYAASHLGGDDQAERLSGSKGKLNTAYYFSFILLLQVISFYHRLVIRLWIPASLNSLRMVRISFYFQLEMTIRHLFDRMVFFKILSPFFISFSPQLPWNFCENCDQYYSPNPSYMS